MAFFRVPLLLTIVDAVIHRLDVSGTRTFDPPGPEASGYDDVFKEPVVYNATPADPSTRTSARQELPVIRVPCQVEVFSQERLQQTFSGNIPDSSLILVTHRADLEMLGLMDLVTQRPKFSIGDRVSGFDQHNLPGVVAKAIPAPGFYVIEIQPASWGFGPIGSDLELLVIADRETGTLRT